MTEKIKQSVLDMLCVITAGIIVGFAYYFFQNSNGFAPGGVGGLATVTYHFVGNFIGESLSWAVLMLSFNIPIFVLVSIFVNRRLGFILMLYMATQSFSAVIFEILECKPYLWDGAPRQAPRA